MKIFGLIHNYPFGTEAAEPLFGSGAIEMLELPDSSILRSGNPFFVPDFDSEFVAFPSLCYRIGKLGKSVARRFAPRYVDGWTMGAAVVAVNRLKQLRSASMPWTGAIAFDRSTLLGNLQPIDTLSYYGRMRMQCGTGTLDYLPGLLCEGLEGVVGIVSANNTIKTGDLIFAGLAPQGLRVLPGEKLRIGAIPNKDLTGDSPVAGTTPSNITCPDLLDLLEINIK